LYGKSKKRRRRLLWRGGTLLSQEGEETQREKLKPNDGFRVVKTERAGTGVSS